MFPSATRDAAAGVPYRASGLVHWPIASFSPLVPCPLLMEADISQPIGLLLGRIRSCGQANARPIAARVEPHAAFIPGWRRPGPMKISVRVEAPVGPNTDFVH